MLLRTTVPALLTLLAVSLPSSAQIVQGSHGSAGKLAFLLPTLYGTNGLRLPNPDHEAHFDSDFQANFSPLNAAIGTQLTSLPIPSPASGFTYSFDPDLGIYERTAESFGPILAERAETIGKNKFYFGFAYQHFGFDKLDDLDLGNIPSVFGHSPTTDPNFIKDIITTTNSLSLQIGQATTFFSYGLSDRIDVSIAVPFISASMDVVSNATIQRIGTRDLPGDPPHTFEPAPQDSIEERFESSGSAAGLGDVIFRVKGTVIKRERVGLALGLDSRMPTGDELNFLGSGSYGFKPFAALSFRAGRIAPHFNAAYQWNGDSLLSGNIDAGTRARLPSQWFFAAGADVRVTPQFTLAFDYFAKRQNGAQRAKREPFTAADGSVFPNTTVFIDSFYQYDASAGFKANVFHGMLVQFNLLFKLNDGGLRDNVTPLIGISYTL